MKERSRLFRIWLWLSAVCAVLWTSFIYITNVQFVNLFWPSAFMLLIPPIPLLITVYLSMWIWERLGAANWSRLPVNVRKGVLRLYIVLMTPWILWFAYRIYDDVSDYYDSSDLILDFVLLCSLPLGVIVLFMIAGWVVDGFFPQQLHNVYVKKKYESKQGGAQNVTISDYKVIIKRAISQLSSDRPDTRAAIYARARTALLSIEFVSDDRLKQNSSNLEDAISMIENEYSDIVDNPRLSVAKKGSTALLAFTILALPGLWIIDFTSMSIYWVARPRKH